MDNTDRLTQLRRAVERERGIRTALGQMKTYREALEQKVTALKDSLLLEDQDVADLQGVNISTLLLTIRGKLGERKEQHEAEALAIRLKLGESESELADVISRMDALCEEHKSLAGSEPEYDQLFEQKKQRLIREGSAVSQRIVTLSEDAIHAESKLKAVSEALKAGESIVAALDGAMESLKKAEEFKEMEFGTRGMGEVKYEYLDAASKHTDKAKQLLEVFKNEANNIEAMRDNSTITGLLVADILFENIIPDWYTGGKVNRAKTRIAVIRSEIFCDVIKLSQLSDETQRALNGLTAQLDALVLATTE